MARVPQGLTRRQWLQRAALGTVGATFATGLYAWRIEPHWVSVTHRRMPLTGPPDGLEGKRLVQISDLHVGPVVDNGYLRRVLRRVAGLRPNWLVITGDFMTTELDEQVAPTLDTLGELPLDQTPTVAVLGNHDYGRFFREHWVADRLAEGLGRLGVTVLRNESVDIGGLQIAGCGDLWAGECDVYRALSHVDTDRAAVFLAHNPDVADVRGWGGFRGWVLSGHTHGGQCRFPFIGAPVLPIRNHRYARGAVRLSGGRSLYVNRGLGYKRRVRFGVRPEVTVFTLTAA